MKKRLDRLSELWFYSTIKQEQPNLVIQCYIQRKRIFVNIGVYYFDSITGISKVSNIIPTMTYDTAFKFLTDNQ